MVANQSDQDGHVLGPETHPTPHFADDLYSHVGVIAWEPFPDVVEQCSHQK